MIYKNVDEITLDVVSAFYDFYIVNELLYRLEKGNLDIDDEKFEKYEYITDMIIKWYDFGNLEYVEDLNMNLITQYFTYKNDKDRKHTIFDYTPWKIALFRKTLEIEESTNFDFNHDIDEWIESRYIIYKNLNKSKKRNEQKGN